jgi:hypothetical protein
MKAKYQRNGAKSKMAAAAAWQRNISLQRKRNNQRRRNGSEIIMA